MQTTTLEKAFESASVVIARLGADDLSEMTPCEGWTVRMLLNHMIGANRAFAAGVPVGEVNPKCDPEIDLFDDDPAGAYATSWPGVVRAWGDAADDGVTTFPWGPMPNAIACQLLVLESTVHGWDLARATGGDDAIPADLVDTTLGLATMLFADPANRGVDFGPPVDVAPDATPTGRLVAFLGRRP